jgi:hypothetical protein
MDVNAEKDVIIKKGSEFWKKIRYYVIGGVALIVLVIGIIFLGRWYASDAADELAIRIHERWMATDGRALYTDIAIQRNKIQELDQKYSDQKTALDDARKKWGRGISNVIKSGDTKIIAGTFDNLVDRYSPPASWDK